MNSAWFIIAIPLILFVLCVVISFYVNMLIQEHEYQAECKLANINDLFYLKQNNSDEFIKEAEFILKYLKNKSYSEFYEFRYGKSKHNRGYYLVGYTSKTNAKIYFPCHNIMGNYGYPDYYLKDMNGVEKYYIDLLWRELNYMLKEKIRLDEYKSKKEL